MTSPSGLPAMPEMPKYPPLPKVGPIGYASIIDVEVYAAWLKIGPHLPGVRDISLWTKDQMQAYARQYALTVIEEAAKKCEERGRAYRDCKAPGWFEVDHESSQCAAAIRAMASDEVKS